MMQRSTTASSDDHGPVRRIVRRRITFPDQVNVAPRFSKVLFTAAPPSLVLFRLQPPHVALLKGTKRPTPGLRPVFDRLVSRGKPDSAWARVPFVSLPITSLPPRASISQSAASPTSLPVRSQASDSLARRRASTSAPPAVASCRRTHWRHRYARSRFVHHGIDFSKGFPIADKPACVIVASRIVLGDEDVPSLRQLSQRRGVAVIRLLIDQERHSLRQTLPIFLFSKTHVLECGHVFAVRSEERRVGKEC